MNEPSQRRHVRARFGALLALPILTWSFPAIADPPTTEPVAAEPTEPAAPEPTEPAAPEAAEPVAAAPADADPVTSAAAVEPVAPAAEPVAGLAPAAEPVAVIPASTGSPEAMSGTLGTTRRAPAETTPRIGAMADVGVPDGATVSIVYRPIRMVR